MGGTARALPRHPNPQTQPELGPSSPSHRPPLTSDAPGRLQGAGRELAEARCLRGTLHAGRAAPRRLQRSYDPSIDVCRARRPGKSRTALLWAQGCRRSAPLGQPAARALCRPLAPPPPPIPPPSKLIPASAEVASIRAGLRLTHRPVLQLIATRNRPTGTEDTTQRSGVQKQKLASTGVLTGCELDDTDGACNRAGRGGEQRPCF